MSTTLSERRMVENEVFFRSHNERIQEGLNELEKMAKEDNQESLLRNSDSPLQFFCECSDENCRKRIRMQPSAYNKIHTERDHFIVVPGHETVSIESVVDVEANFCIVKKNIKAPETAKKLNKTTVRNV